jgi:hypothetical protein
MLLVSVGTGRERINARTIRGDQMNLLFYARSIPLALIDSINLQQDAICRMVGDCQEGAPIDAEIGDLRGGFPGGAERKQFSYVRYDHLFSSEDMDRARQINKLGLSIDNLAVMPFLCELGKRYATAHVKAEHLR